MSKKIQLILPVLLAGLAALLMAGYLNKVEKKYRTGAEESVVLVAKSYIDRGTMVTQDMVRETKVPKQFVQPKTLSSPKDLVNKEGNLAYMSIVPFMENEQIITTKLAPLGFETGVSAVIPTEMRSIAVLADATEVLGIVRPGSRVDVVVVLDYVEGGQRKEKAVTLLQNVQVLAVGRRIVGSVDPKKSQGSGSGAVSAEEEMGGGRVPVSLALTPEEVEVIVLAKQKGTIVLPLRGIGDDKIHKLTGITLSRLAGGEEIVRTRTKSSAEVEAEKKRREEESLLKKYGQ